MIKICILTYVLIQFYFSPYSTAKHAEDDAAKYKGLHSLLRDPVDEEHDELERESDATHAHEWTIQIHRGNEQTAKELADAYGFEVVSKVEVGDGVFRFLNPKDGNEENKKDGQNKNNEDNNSYTYIQKRESLLQELDKRLGSDKRILWYKRERILTREKRVPVDFKVSTIGNRHVTLSDPQFPNQWYILNNGQTTGPKRFDSNVVPVWDMGYTGKGVSISILDDGMDHTHPDLIDNYDQEASKDLNGHDNDPFPNDSDPYNAHGTKCSGTVAASGNNSLCGIGIAYNASIGAIRMLDGKATDGLEANALSFHRDHIDIYSCSWGPKDNGRTFGRPGTLGRIALAQGAKYGRNGKGSLFVWATGNGGLQKDDCNADGYVNSIYTMGIGSVNEHGVSTYYGEKCSAMFAVTYCSGGHSLMSRSSHANVITTYLHHQCTQHFVGTSSAAPLAAGIFALVLEANRNITWRDMQHLLFHTAKITSPLDRDWQKNGCGKSVNHKFGFGLLDAFLLVNLALNWTLVPEQRRCHFRLNFRNGDIPSKRHFKLNFTTDACQSCSDDSKMKDGKCKNAVEKLEHVVVNVTLKHRRRGDLSISLISPHGTISHLLRRRPYDNSDSGLKGWSFMTVFNWCENPSGTWQLVFEDNTSDGDDSKKRDLEEEYVKYLDKRKLMEEKRRAQEGEESEDKDDEKEKKENNKSIFDNADARDDESFSVNAQVENKKRGGEADESKNTVTEPKDTVAKSTHYSDDSSNSNEGNDQYYRGDSYRREEETRKKPKEDSYYSGSYRRKDYDVDNNYGYYNYRRKRREAVKKMDIDEQHIRQMQMNINDEDIKYKDPVLKRSELAGEVTAISVTFYGTA